MAHTRDLLRFLCLEDNARDQLLLQATLSAGGFNCDFVMARTKEEFELGLHQRVDVILSDFTLPAYDGMRALALARQTCPETPFLFVSGTIGEERAVESLKRGATDYILKTSLSRLVPAIERALVESSERKRRRAAELALTESLTRFQQVADTIEQAFWIKDVAANNVVYISPGYDKIWGPNSAHRWDQPTLWLETLHPDDRERLRALLTEPRNEAYEISYRIIRKDGSIRFVRERGYPLKNETGEVTRIVSTAEDVSERRLLEEQLQHSQKMEAVGRLAAGTAHEFRNLLTVILMAAELAKEESGATEPILSILSATRRAGELAHQLLAFGRKGTLQTRLIHLPKLIQEFDKMLRLLGRNDFSVVYQHEPNLPCIQADGGMLEQVLLNLVVNARDAMPGGGIVNISTSRILLDPVRAKLHSKTAETEYVCMSVRDSGCGIPEESMGMLFEPFFTTKPAGKGTGLGLAIVYSVVRDHHGWVEVTSQPGQGTTFSVFLPAVKAGLIATDNRLS